LHPRYGVISLFSNIAENVDVKFCLKGDGSDRGVVTVNDIANRRLAYAPGKVVYGSWTPVVFEFNNQGSPTLTISYNGAQIYQGFTTVKNVSVMHLRADKKDSSSNVSIDYDNVVCQDPTLTKTDTATTLSPSRNNPAHPVVGQYLQYDAYVAPRTPGTGPGTPPKGTVTFTIDGSTTVTADVINGWASWCLWPSRSVLPAGSHTITARYIGDTDFNGSAAANPSSITFVIAPAHTSTHVSASPGNPVFGQRVTLTATVSVDQPGRADEGVHPTQWVDFFDNGRFLGRGLVHPDGKASFFAERLAVGSHSITARYNDTPLPLTTRDPNFTSSPLSDPLTVTIAKAYSATVVTSSQQSAPYGAWVTFTTNVSAVAPGAGLPGGQVTFSVDYGKIVFRTPLTAGTASFRTDQLTIGSHHIGVSYSGDANFIGSSGAMTETITRAATGMVLTAAPTPASVYGTSVTLTATFTFPTRDGRTPSGNVIFTDIYLPTGKVTYLATRLIPTSYTGRLTFTYTTSKFQGGAHRFWASYSGDSCFLPSSSWIDHRVLQAPTTTKLTVSPQVSVQGQKVTLTANVSPVSLPRGWATGTVVFREGNTILGTGSVDTKGTATCTTTALTVGKHTITAEYSGDLNFQLSSSTGITQTVQQAATTTVVTTSANPSGYGRTVTFTVTVLARAPGSGTPTGTVTFKDGTTILGTGTLNASGKVSFTTSALKLGVHTLTASYGGDRNFLASSGSITETIK
jgi:hypothetical protein